MDLHVHRPTVCWQAERTSVSRMGNTLTTAWWTRGEELRLRWLTGDSVFVHDGRFSGQSSKSTGQGLVFRQRWQWQHSERDLWEKRKAIRKKKKEKKVENVAKAAARNTKQKWSQLFIYCEKAEYLFFYSDCFHAGTRMQDVQRVLSGCRIYLGVCNE